MSRVVCENGLVGADDAEAMDPRGGSALPSRQFAARGRGEFRGGDTDSILGSLDWEDMLREVSKLPPEQRADALKEMKKRRRKMANGG